MLIEKLARIDTLHSKLSTMRPLNAGELKQLREQFMVENTYNSNAIEGNTLTLLETALVLQEGLTIAEKSLRAHLEAIGHRDAFFYMVGLAEAARPLTEQTIKEIHALVLMDDAENRGVYRKVPVIITGANHTPPQPYLIEPQMQSLLSDYEELQAGKHPVEAVSEFHLRFEGVHPFIDGNGRTGRLVLNLELMKAGLLPVSIKFADRRKYYDCFDSYFAADGEGATLLTNLVADYEIEELEKYIGILGG